mmetsp:Transcript_13542/g.36374  ORF Transcript_13542/g.36374 Transcript_13542/m.36374 type:complete len:221 (-) Transcript_13542:2463-3125(-)
MGDGSEVGSCVGTDVGTSVGTAVGDSVGSSVGFNGGSGVGRSTGGSLCSGSNSGISIAFRPEVQTTSDCAVALSIITAMSEDTGTVTAPVICPVVLVPCALSTSYHMSCISSLANICMVGRAGTLEFCTVPMITRSSVPPTVVTCSNCTFVRKGSRSTFVPLSSNSTKNTARSSFSSADLDPIHIRLSFTARKRPNSLPVKPCSTGAVIKPDNAHPIPRL